MIIFCLTSFCAPSSLQAFFAFSIVATCCGRSSETAMRRPFAFSETIFPFCLTLNITCAFAGAPGLEVLA